MQKYITFIIWLLLLTFNVIVLILIIELKALILISKFQPSELIKYVIKLVFVYLINLVRKILWLNSYPNILISLEKLTKEHSECNKIPSNVSWFLCITFTSTIIQLVYGSLRHIIIVTGYLEANKPLTDATNDLMINVIVIIYSVGTNIYQLDLYY